MTKLKKFYYLFLFFLTIGITEAQAFKMIILKGINGQLDVASATATAKKLRFDPIVLNSSGENYINSPQAKEALNYILKDPQVVAIYAFSGGGYNARNVFKVLTPTQRGKINTVIILGAPGVTKNDFPKVPNVQIIPDSPYGHLDTPRWFLSKLK